MAQHVNLRMLNFSQSGTMAIVRSNKEKILDLVSKIKKGKVTTYGRIAKSLGIRSPRSVGKVLHHNPDPKKYPCHRVVFKDGSLAEHYAFGGKKAQMALLKSEGVGFFGEKADISSHLA